ncbi:hypothetical protein [Clostridium sp.]|uniref:hypothetical protein n=1 Tax=Clostridium sp. TaxID=1506 RepID=UPI003D6D0D59
MKNKNVMIKLVVGLIIASLIRFIGIDNIPFIVVLGVFLFGVLYFVWSIIRVKKGERKDKYYIIFAYNIIALSIAGIILYITPARDVLVVNYLLIPISIGLLISTTISVYVWAIMSNKK